jgi:uncharacterized membrane protein
MRSDRTRKLTFAAAIAALYAALSLLSSAMGMAYGPVQFRVSEALCVLPFLFPETMWGLFIGCIITNILSPYGLLDLIVGSLATLLAGFLTSRCRSQYLAPLPPVLANGVLVGGMLAFEQVNFGAGFWAAFAFNGFTVALGEAAVCYVLGLLLLRYLPRIPYFRQLLAQRKSK